MCCAPCIDPAWPPSPYICRNTLPRLGRHLTASFVCALRQVQVVLGLLATDQSNMGFVVSTIHRICTSLVRTNHDTSLRISHTLRVYVVFSIHNRDECISLCVGGGCVTHHGLLCARVTGADSSHRPERKYRHIGHTDILLPTSASC